VSLSGAEGVGGGAEGVGSTWGAWSRFDFFFKAFTAHLSRSVAWSYPVTPLGVFGLSGAFDKWNAINAINAPNLESACSGVPPMPEHAGMDTLGPAG